MTPSVGELWFWRPTCSQAWRTYLVIGRGIDNLVLCLMVRAGTRGVELVELDETWFQLDGVTFRHV